MGTEQWQLLFQAFCVSAPPEDGPTPEQLFATHQSRAKALVSNYCRVTNPFVAYLKNDIESEAMIGLWQACQRFKQNTNNTFWSFAQLRVRGAILDFLRRERLQVRSDGKDGWGGVAIVVVPLTMPGDEPGDNDMRLEDKRSQEAIEHIETRLSIDKSISAACLSDKTRRALVDFYYEGQTMEEISPLKARALTACR